MINLEPLAASTATGMVGSDPNAAENLITKALLVLSEQGLYAFGLFLSTRTRPMDTKAASDVHNAIRSFLRESGLGSDDGGDRPADYYRGLAQTREAESEINALQRLLLTKQVVETALTYGRYQAKARKSE